MGKHVRRGFVKREKPKYDFGTPELIKRRMAALGPRRVGPNGKPWPEPNPADAESAMGILLWQGRLADTYERSKRMHDAGVTFAGWWLLVYPQTHSHSTLSQFLPRKGLPGETEMAEACLRAASAFLKKEPRVLHAVINVAVYQSMENRHVDKLRTGLCRLIEWMRTPEAERIREQFTEESAA